MKAVFRIAKLKTFGNIGGLNAHCERTMDVPNADKELQQFNKRKIGSTDMVADVKARMLEANIDIENLRKNGVLAFELVLTTSSEFFDLKKTNEGGKIGLSLRNINEAQAWVNQSTNWLKEEFGANLVSVHLHNDEKTPHIHAVVVPIDPKGRMNCSHFLGDKIKLAKMQDRYADSVKSLGLERGVVGSKDVHKQPSKFHAEQVEKRIEEEKSIEARVKVLKTERLSENAKIQEVKKDLDNYKAIEQQHQNRLNVLQNQIKSLEKESELIISKAKDDAKKITDGASMKLAQVNDYVSKITNNVDVRIAEAINQKFNVAPAFYLNPSEFLKDMPEIKVKPIEAKRGLLGDISPKEHEKVINDMKQQFKNGLSSWEGVFQKHIIESSDIVAKELKQISDFKYAQEMQIQREKRLQEARNQGIDKEKGKERGQSM